MIRSVRFSLTVWYAGILTVILSLFGGILYSDVTANLYREKQALLNSKASGIGEAIFSFWKAERETQMNKLATGDATPADDNQFFLRASTEELSALVKRWAEQTKGLDETQPPIRIFGKDGLLYAFSPEMKELQIPVNQDVMNRALLGQTVFEIFEARGRKYSLITRPILKSGHFVFVIQTVSSLRQTNVELAHLRKLLFWLIPLTVLVTSVMGWFLASLALHPIARMIAQAQKISESRLHERIDVPRTQDEVEKLAVTFNEMLGRFEQGFKRLRQFSAAASHELRTPLTVMKGEMELVLRKPRMEEEYERVLKTQLQVVNDMSRVVEQLLAVAHAETGELAVEWTPIELRNLIEGVAAHYQTIAAEKRISVDLNIPETELKILGEKSLLERLVSNLLENALKHAPAEGHVWIRGDGAGDHAVMTVADDGPGILPDDMPRVFDKFFTRRNWPERSRSTGIGLGLCRWIVELHKGKIKVESLAGKGAQFTVTFPAFKNIYSTGQGPEGGAAKPPSGFVR
jgi:heavy metal sensor kinase